MANMAHKTTIKTLYKMKQEGEKIATLTAYDASFARIIDEQGVDVILVGDSLGMVIQGHDTTIPVTVDDMIYHTRTVARQCKKALLMVDLPFMSYTSPHQAVENAARLMQEGLAQMVKLEGGALQAETVRKLSHYGVPVCAHLGLQPQSVHKQGGYRVQGKDQKSALQMIEDAVVLQDVGADALLLECVPNLLAQEISSNLSIPTIGIGAGPHCDGQVLVLHDMLGITPSAPRFTKDFLQQNGNIAEAIKNFVTAVKEGTFPEDKHCFI
ncbi:MAG TPA: 3-methyl-2-oxobutanoate hydroxymethyltransferase [Thiothrix sp.]|nr:3-methyl-2-oxobutanoate hydroxymethyltransferase [Thiothrix sp.]